MRKIIVDGNFAADSAVALLMALGAPGCEILAVTAVGGAVPLEEAAQNALEAIGLAGLARPPVYLGMAEPLVRDPLPAQRLHPGGMGGRGATTSLRPEAVHAVDAMIEAAAKNPYKAELVLLGSATNAALAIKKAPVTMGKLKSVTVCAGAGTARGDATPVAEQNAYTDAEALDIVLRSGLPVTLVGLDVASSCLWQAADADTLRESPRGGAQFAADWITGQLQRARGRAGVPLRAATAMAVALSPEVVLEAPNCACHTCLHEEAAYGQVIIDDGSPFSAGRAGAFAPNAAVIRAVDARILRAEIGLMLTAQGI